MKKELFLGIDVSKGYADFVLLNEEGKVEEESFRLIDNNEGRQKLLDLIKEWKEKGCTTLFCGVESTGGYENNWHSVLKGLQPGGDVFATRLNPKAVKAVSDAVLRRTITDAVSAENIALYLVKFPEKVDYGIKYIPDEKYREGRAHLTAIQMHIKQRSQLLNQLNGWLYGSFPEMLIYCRENVPLWFLKMLIKYPTPKKVSSTKGGLIKIKGISKDKAEELRKKASENTLDVSDYTAHLISSTAREILRKTEVIKDEEKYLETRYKDNEAVKLITSIPGVGIASAVKFMLEIEDVNRFESSKKMASFFGVHPSFKQSGDGKWKSRMSKRGRGIIRATLYMCCLSGMQHNPILKSIYYRYKDKGMNHDQATGVIMHKLLRMIYGVLKSGEPFDVKIDQKNRQNAENKRNLEKEKLENKSKEGKRKLYRYQDLGTEGPISGRRVAKIKKQMASQSPIEGANAGLPSADTKI